MVKDSDLNQMQPPNRKFLEFASGFFEEKPGSETSQTHVEIQPINALVHHKHE